MTNLWRVAEKFVNFSRKIDSPLQSYWQSLDSGCVLITKFTMEIYVTFFICFDCSIKKCSKTIFFAISDCCATQANFGLATKAEISGGAQHNEKCKFFVPI
jgi:hypothetical protein